MNDGIKAQIDLIQDELCACDMLMHNSKSSDTAIGMATEIGRVHDRMWKLMTGQIQGLLTELRQMAREYTKEKLKKQGEARKKK